MSLLFYLICSLIAVAQQVCFAADYGTLDDYSSLQGKRCPDFEKVCPCGIEGEQHISVLVKMRYNVNMTTGESGCVPCNSHLIPSDLCKRYENCATCSLESCLTCPEGRTGKFCSETVQGNNLGSEPKPRYRREVHIPRGKPISHNRVLRSKDGCDFPKEMKTTDLACTLYDYQVTCNATCAWGHALKGQTVTYYECKYYNKYWTPYRNFEECSPIVNCGVELVSNGMLSCISMQLDKPDVCKISCSTYDEEEGGDIPERAYTCDLNGSFNPPLPYCARKNGTMNSYGGGYF